MQIAPLSFIFMEGDAGDKMYVIRSGKVRIMKREGSHMATLAELGPGSILGEMSLLDHQPRSATAKTLETTELVVIDQAMLESTYQTLPPWLTAIIRMIVQRLRETTARKYIDDMEHSLPALLFLLCSHYEESGSAISHANLASQIRVLYGLAYSDLQKILEVFQDLKLLQLSQDSQNPDRITLLNPNVLALLRKCFLDANASKPTKENLLSDTEQQWLQTLADLTQTGATVRANCSLVPLKLFMEKLKASFPEAADKSQTLNNLALGSYIQTVPQLQESVPNQVIDQIGIERDRILDILELNRVWPELTVNFATRVKGK